MPFFDFLKSNVRYADHPLNINRLNRRHEFLVAPYASEIAGKRVLDLASHDGRWSYALSAAGAGEVVGVEAREDQIAQFDRYPAGEVKDRVRFVPGDVYVELPRLVEEGQRFDVVAVYGLFYHVMDHYGLLKLVKQLGAELVIIDSEFYLHPDPVIRFATESTDSHLNTIAHDRDQDIAPVAVPSAAALETMATSLGYDVTWADWESVPVSERGGLRSYYRTAPSWKRRDTCALRRRRDL